MQPFPMHAGYGGGGTAFGDLWVLHLGDATGHSPSAFQWEEVQVGLPAPAPRFDHACCAIPTAANSQQPDKLVLLGGRDSSQHFTDSWWLDLSTWTWQTGSGVPVLAGQVRSEHGEMHSTRVLCRPGARCVDQMAAVHQAVWTTSLRSPASPTAGLQPPVLLSGQRTLPKSLRRLRQQLRAQVQQRYPGGLLDSGGGHWKGWSAAN